MNRVRRNIQPVPAHRANGDVESSGGRCKLIERRWPDRRGPSCRAIIASVVATFVVVVVWKRLNADPAAEEWSPAAWGTPWGSLSPTWADVAASKKSAYDGTVSEALEQQLLSAGSLTSPVRLKYPVLWAGPFFTHSGYGTEAISYVAGLLQHGLVSRDDLWIVQAGDEPHDDVVAAMDPSLRQLLWEQEYRNITRRLPPSQRDRPLIVVCHTFPDCWRTPLDDLAKRWTLRRVINGIANFVKYQMIHLPLDKDNGCPCPNKYIKDRVVYRVGRSMFETERLPAGLAAYAHHLDEVLVPSDFNVRSFSAAGVPSPKLHTLAQGINTTLFNPDVHSALPLTSLGGQLVVGTPRSARRAGAMKARPVSSAGHRRLETAGGSGGPEAAGGHSSDESSRDDGPLATRQGVRLHAGGHTAGTGLLRTDGSPASSAHAARTPESSDRQVGTPDSGARGGMLWPVRSGPPSGVRPFRFLSVFKWEARKGWDVLLAAFLSEFGGGEHVELHIVTHEFSTRIDDFRASVRDAISKLLNVTDDATLDALPRVYVYNKYIPDSLYPGLYKAVDVLAVPTHGEGWGRPQFEAMAMGLPVISTNWSGLTAFMDERVAYPIRVEAVVDVKDDSPSAFKWFKGQRWAQPSLHHLRQLMRHVVANASDAAAKGAAARHLIRSEFSTEAVARKALVEILRIQHHVDQLLGGGAAGSSSLPASALGDATSWATSTYWTGGWNKNTTGVLDGGGGPKQRQTRAWRKLWG